MPAMPVKRLRDRLRNCLPSKSYVLSRANLIDTNIDMEFATYEARVASFAPPTKRAKGWPHKTPAPQDLAKAGFFWKPTSSKDNVECFICGRHLDGWEKDDDALREHFKHGPDCAWASLMTLEADPCEPASMEDPTGATITDARRSTFEILGWPHEEKRGWTCKTEKMVEAGWHFAPTTECEDYTSCVYCKLSLDGWEPNDNPFEEHYRRSPDCPFFAFAGTTQPSKRPKKKGARASRSSKASRLSSQSNTTVMSQIVDESTGNIEILGVDTTLEDTVQDNSIVSIQSTTSTATAKGKRKAPARAKTAPSKRSKTARAKKNEEDSQPEPDTQPELTEAESQQQSQPPSKKTRGTKKKADIEIDDSQPTQEPLPGPKRSRGKKKAPKSEPEPEPEPEPNVDREMDDSIQFVKEEPKRKTSRGKRKENTPEPIEHEEKPLPEPPLDDVPDIEEPYNEEEAKDDAAPSDVDQPTYPALPAETPDEEFADAPELPEAPHTGPRDEEELGPPAKVSSPIPVKQISPLKEQSNPPRPSLPSMKQEEPKLKRRSSRRSSRKQEAQNKKEPSPVISHPSDQENRPPSSLPRTSRPPLSSPGAPPPVWTAIDVDTVFQDVGAQEIDPFGGAVHGILSEQEKEMTVQEWIEHVGAQAFANLSDEGERIVTIFEREGQRALTALESIQCV